MTPQELITALEVMQTNMSSIVLSGLLVNSCISKTINGVDTLSMLPSKLRIFSQAVEKFSSDADELLGGGNTYE